MRVAIISDTHMPSRETAIPEFVQDAVRDADHTIHVGDFDSPEGYEAVMDIVDEDAFTAVKGNMDPDELGLPEVATVEFEGVPFVAIHGTGPRNIDEYLDLVAETAREHGGENAIGLCGHTHDRMDETHDGVRLLNPGSATGADPADEASMLVADVAGGKLDVTVLREAGATVASE